MGTRVERLRCLRVAESSCPDRLRRDHGFTLVEVMICTLILTTGMIGIAGLLAVTTQMHVGAREATRSSRLAEDKVDELMKMDFATDPAVAVGGSLTADVVNYFETPGDGITLRWSVANGPVASTRIVTVRVQNLRAQQYGRQVDLSTMIRQW